MQTRCEEDQFCRLYFSPGPTKHTQLSPSRENPILKKLSDLKDASSIAPTSSSCSVKEKTISRRNTVTVKIFLFGKNGDMCAFYLCLLSSLLHCSVRFMYYSLRKADASLRLIYLRLPPLPRVSRKGKSKGKRPGDDDDGDKKIAANRKFMKAWRIFNECTPEAPSH
ncbi:hypothetical protein AVEN_182504-1 [Araneus ventricosus]|uniref:Uncharacterized protein n=1 Tax=Araneus ventricosus TaxID=182803 RepID=A0A4Y2BXY6_ARAVE|nr:hypothetical protein AVEN_182504-1 [Araneus ventricosus]